MNIFYFTEKTARTQAYTKERGDSNIAVTPVKVSILQLTAISHQPPAINRFPLPLQQAQNVLGAGIGLGHGKGAGLGQYLHSGEVG